MPVAQVFIQLIFGLNSVFCIDKILKTLLMFMAELMPKSTGCIVDKTKSFDRITLRILLTTHPGELTSQLVFSTTPTQERLLVCYLSLSLHLPPLHPHIHPHAGVQTLHIVDLIQLIQ